MERWNVFKIAGKLTKKDGELREIQGDPSEIGKEPAKTHYENWKFTIATAGLRKHR